jgi:hypothetical protein
MTQFELVEEKLSNGNTIVYKVVGGTYFHAETPLEVCNALNLAKNSGKRIRVWIGDRLGKSRLEEHDVEGYVGNSGGKIKIPILIHNSRSFGGGALFDQCIVKIQGTDGTLIYFHPGFSMPELSIIPADLEGYAETVLADGKVHASFRKVGQAQRWINKMRG